jgi:hypothetical protein
LKNKNQIIFAVFGAFVISVVIAIVQAVNFNNQMISLQELKKAEIETTKVEYGQCVVKILETNDIADLYLKDVLTLAGKAGDNLEQFNSSLMALIGTQVIPQLSFELRANVQREIISCRNAYVGRVDLGLKPMYVQFNRLQRQFPNSVYNTLAFHWQTEDLEMPKADAGNDIFSTGKIEALNLVK